MERGASDTHPAIHRMMIAGYRRMTPTQKLKRVAELTRCTRQLARARILADYPDATEREVRLRLASLYIDRDTMIRAFGWDPVLEGR